MDYAPFIISMKTAICATIITFIIGTYAAYLVMKTKGTFRLILDGIFTLPLVLPPTVAGFFLLLLLGKNGPLGRIFHALDIQVIFTWQATVIAAVVISFPLMYRSAKSSFEQIDQNLIYAGRTLGMSEWTIFVKVTMPLALPGIISGGILAFARALGEFGATLMIAGNIPKVTQTIPVAIYMATQGNRMDQAMLWVGVIALVSFIVIFLMNYIPTRNRRFHTKRKE